MNGSFGKFPKPSAGDGKPESSHDAISVDTVEPIAQVAQELERQLAAKNEPGSLSPQEAEDLNDTLRELGL